MMPNLTRLFLSSVLKDPDSNPYSLLDNTESDQTADTDASESHHSTNRRRRSRRRRTDEDASLMDGTTESDNASVNENGLGMFFCCDGIFLKISNLNPVYRYKIVFFFFFT